MGVDDLKRPEGPPGIGYLVNLDALPEILHGVQWPQRLVPSHDAARRLLEMLGVEGVPEAGVRTVTVCAEPLCKREALNGQEKCRFHTPIQALRDHLSGTVNGVNGAEAPLAEALPRVERRWTRETAIEAVLAFHEREGRPPTTRDAGSKGGLPGVPLRSDIADGWSHLIELAGLERAPAPSQRKWTREKIIDAIAAHVLEHGETPTANGWANASDTHPGQSTVIQRFGSWKAAIVAAGFEPRARGGQQGNDNRSGRAEASCAQPAVETQTPSPDPAAPEVREEAPAGTGDGADLAGSDSDLTARPDEPTSSFTPSDEGEESGREPPAGETADDQQPTVSRDEQRDLPAVVADAGRTACRARVPPRDPHQQHAAAAHQRAAPLQRRHPPRRSPVPPTARPRAAADLGRDPRAHRGDDVTGRRNDWWNLTEREHQILALAADGLNGPEISRDLHLGLQTVKFHRTNLFQKLGAKNMPHAISLAYKQRLLQIPDSPELVVTINGVEYRRAS